MLDSEVTGKTLKAFKKRILCSDLSFQRVSLTGMWEIKKGNRKPRDQFDSYRNLSDDDVAWERVVAVGINTSR